MYSYVTRMDSYVTCVLLVCYSCVARMLLVCYSCITSMLLVSYSFVTRMLLVCYSYVARRLLVRYSYVTRMHLYVTRMHLYVRMLLIHVLVTICKEMINHNTCSFYIDRNNKLFTRKLHFASCLVINRVNLYLYIDTTWNFRTIYTLVPVC